MQIRILQTFFYCPQSFLILILIINKIVFIVKLLRYYVCLFVYIIMFFSTLVFIVSNFIVACAFVTCY